MPPTRVRFWTYLLMRYKAERMWNINVNMLLADLLSTAFTAAIIEAIHERLAMPLHIVAVTAAVDGVASLAMFATLHLYANWDRGFKDLLHLQVHRWFLAPLVYVIGISLQWLLLAAGVRASVGVLIAYWGTLLLIRLIHTLYGKRSGLFR